MIMNKDDIFEYEINMFRKNNYKFEVDFGKDTISPLLMDEPEEIPGGESAGPMASMLVAAAVGNCLSASLIFCLTKMKTEITDIKTRVKVTRKRNEEGFWRISQLTINIEPKVENKESLEYLKCMDIFKKYCIVGNSVEEGIPLKVTIDGK
jgi:uncharacterized OsmC-like protein